MRMPRLYLEDSLHVGVRIDIEQERAHYLRNVMRLRPGDRTRLFNTIDGEWAGRVAGIERRTVQVEVEKRLREPSPEPGPELYFAPLKRHRQEMLVEKAVELGVASMKPVSTAHGVVERISVARTRSRIIEAVEQSERMTVPTFEAIVELDKIIDGRKFLMADERGGKPLLQALDDSPDAAFLVGPEGGFSAEERTWLHAAEGVNPVTLGPTILRAETAAIFMLSVWRAWQDDLVEE